MSYLIQERTVLRILAPLFFFTALLVFIANCVGQQSNPQEAPLEKAANLVGADLDLVHNHDPAVEQANFDLLEGFEVNLFATDPMLANPVHMTWAPDGKLYVACSWAYPQLKPGEKANDKIIVLEDTNDDGVADKSTVFADGLYLPTGLELANGGVFVAQSPHVLFLKDTDGDGVSDVREIALTGGLPRQGRPGETQGFLGVPAQKGGALSDLAAGFAQRFAVFAAENSCEIGAVVINKRRPVCDQRASLLQKQLCQPGSNHGTRHLVIIGASNPHLVVQISDKRNVAGFQTLASLSDTSITLGVVHAQFGQR